MKEYLFDKVVIDDNRIQFYTCRQLTESEKFLARVKFGDSFNGTFNNGIYYTALAVDYIFTPNNFRQFLNCLESTKLNDETKEYNILLERNSCSKQISLGEALKIFVNVYSKLLVKLPENQIKSFYEKAYNIYKDSKRTSEILNKEPEELIK